MAPSPKQPTTNVNIMCVWGPPEPLGLQGPCVCLCCYTSYMQGITNDDHMWQLIDGCHSVVYVTRSSRIYLQAMDLTWLEITVSL